MFLWCGFKGKITPYAFSLSLYLQVKGKISHLQIQLSASAWYIIILQLTGRYSLRVILLTVFIQLNAAEFIKFFVIRVWHRSILTFKSKKLLSMKANFQCLVKLNYRIAFSCFRLYQVLSFEYTELKISLQSRKIIFWACSNLIISSFGFWVYYWNRVNSL